MSQRKNQRPVRDYQKVTHITQFNCVLLRAESRVPPSIVYKSITLDSA
jgi:hypothetical protein